MIGGTERLVYRSLVGLVFPLGFASYVNGKMERYYPCLPKDLLPPALVSDKADLTQGFYVDVPKAWFASKTEGRAEEFAGVMFNQVFPMRVESLWLRACAFVGLPRFQPPEKYLPAVSERGGRMDLDFACNGNGVKPVVSGRHTLVVEDTGKQSARVWFVSNYALSTHREARLEPVASRHAVLGVVPRLVDAETGAELGTLTVAYVYLQRVFWRIMIDSTLTRMMRQRPLIQFFQD